MGASSASDLHEAGALPEGIARLYLIVGRKDGAGDAEIKNLLLGVGFCGQGFMLGPSSGELLARLVQEKTTPADRSILPLLAPDRQFSGEELLK